MSLHVVFDRSSLNLDDLIVRGDAYAGRLWLPEDGVVEPSFAYRIKYAPASDYIAGQRALAAVLDVGSLSLVVHARATADGGTLHDAKEVLEAAASQWAYDLTVNIDGASRTYRADPAWPQWGQVDSGMVVDQIARATLTVPVNTKET